MTTIYTARNNPLLNPRGLPYQARVLGWSITHHRTAEAAERAAKRQAAAAARQHGGWPPEYQIIKLRFD